MRTGWVYVYYLSIFMAQVFHSIKTVVRRTGLTAHAIRIWEKRYAAVEPKRSGTNRRLYTDEEVERLNLLRSLTRSGHNIGSVATLPTQKLRRMAAETPSGEATATVPAKGKSSLLEECIAAMKVLDARAMEDALNRGAVALGAQGLLQKLIAPLAQTIGDLWREGTITAAHEHFASAVIRIFLGHASRSFAVAEGAPVIVVATPTGQIHELGAVLVAAAAANLGWNVTYLGASLPAAEIAGAARQNRTRAVALSLVYPEDDPAMESELARLRELLPTDVALLVGGRAAPAYARALHKAGAVMMQDLTHLCLTLDELRRPPHNAPHGLPNSR